MKKVFMISALLAMVSFANADNIIKVESPAEVPQGGTGFIEVLYNFDQENYFANYSFDIFLPEGVTLNTSKIVKGDCHSENHPKNYTIKENDGFYSLAIMSNPTTALTGTSDVLVKLAVDVDASLALNTELDGAIKNIRFASTGGSTTVFNDIEFKLKVVENIVTLDENSTSAPEAAANVNVLVKRSVKPSNWGTICLPFSMTEEQVQAAFGDGAKLADFDGTEIELDDAKKVCGITVKFVSASSIQANHPYLLQATKEIKYDEGFKVENVSVNPVNTPQVGKDLQYDEDEDDDLPTSFFYGVYVPTVLDKVTYLFLSGNKFYYSNKTTTMKGFRGYFKLQKQLAAEYKDISSSVNVKVSIDDEATYIDGITNGMRVEGVYDLSGRKIKLENSDVTKLQKGVYIINGKKVTIK
ncbi:MAG: hypothetical protein IJK43_06710 [Prevotella sp.]|nr:hypothetical protein [Prevotella sp.]